MKFKYIQILLLFLLNFLIFAQGLAQHSRLLYSDPLDDENSPSMGQIFNNGGDFIAGRGWQATSIKSQLKIILSGDLPFEGTFIIDVTNFDPVSQNVPPPDDIKQHILNMYSQENGNKDIFETNGSWWNIRTGAAYSEGPGMAGFKFLASPRHVDNRDEERCMESATWDLDQVYEFKVTWTRGKIYCYVDDVQVSALGFAGQVEPFRYIYIGRDNLGSGYGAQPGPIYFNLRIYVPDVPIKFTDITTASSCGGYSGSGYGNGVSFADMNQDGRIDLLVSNAINDLVLPDLFYLNKGNNQFVESAEIRGVKDPGATHAIVSADFDNDGDLDAFYSNMPEKTASNLGRNALYRNDGQGYFTNITDWAGIADEKNHSRGAVAIDLENDGDLDLFVANWGQLNEMYLNTGAGKMTRVHRGTDGPTEDPAALGRQGVTAADFDKDGDIDIYVTRRQEANLPAPNWLFVNDGQGNFTEKAANLKVAVGGKSNGATFADVDNDGDLDLFVINDADTDNQLPPLYVFFNNGDGTFTDRTEDFNIHVSGYSLLFGDVDNDADQDLFLIRNNQKESDARPELYLNTGKGEFMRVTGTGFGVSIQDARSAGLADIDSDGDLDVYIAGKKSQNYLLRNDTENKYHYIDILCYGPGGDLGGFGSKVSVYKPGFLGNAAYLLGYQESVSNYAYLCQNQTALHFGLGDNLACDIRIVLTDGSVFDYRNIAANQRFQMEKPKKLKVAYVSGDEQTGYIGAVLAQPFRVRITDMVSQNPAANELVTFAVTLGNGSLQESQPVLTHADGVAEAHLVFGQQEGLYRVEARCNAEGAPIMFQAVASKPPLVLTKERGDNQSGVVGKPLTDSVVVKVSYPSGQIVVNQPVRFRVRSGGGQVAGDSAVTVSTNSRGLAAAAWLLGPGIGEQKVAAVTVDSGVEFTASAAADVPMTLLKVSGDGQVISPGMKFPQPFVARVQDQYGNPVANQLVNFKVISGQGSLSGKSEQRTMTDSAGLAATQWTAGPYSGPDNLLQATSSYNESALKNSPIHWQYPGLDLDPLKSSLSASSPIPANGITSSEITVLLRNSTNQTVGAGLTVRVLATGSENTLLMPDTLTDINGQVKAYLSSTIAEVKTIKALVMGFNLTLPDSQRVIFEPAPRSLLMVSGNNQSGVVGSPLPQPFVVQVLDYRGKGVANIPIQYVVLAGSGNLAGQTAQIYLTDSDGLARATLTPGTRSGILNVVEARLDGIHGSPVIFIATAIASSPISITKVAGDSQRVRPKEQLFEYLRARVVDIFNNPTPGVMVTFTAVNGGQIITPQPVQSDSNGLVLAQAATGEKSGEYYFEASVKNLPVAQFIAFAISDVNHAPIVFAPPDTTISENQELVFNVKAMDPDSDPVTLQATVLPDGASFNAGMFRWTPHFEQAGDHLVVFTATDAKNNHTTAQTSIHVLNSNRPPVIYGFAPTDSMVVAHYGDKVLFRIDAHDPDQDSLNYYFKINGLVAGLGSLMEIVADPSLPSMLAVTGFVTDGLDIDSHTWQLHLIPTGVEMAMFLATLAADGSIQITWETRTELNHAGFNILRSSSESGGFDRINPELISADPVRKNYYQYTDRNIVAGTGYFYKLEAISVTGQVTLHGPIQVFVPAPERIVLHQNYPNPFNPTTAIEFELPEKIFVILQVYNMAGQLVKTLINCEMQPGIHLTFWDGTDANGRPVPSGTYFYQFDAHNFHQVKKLILAR